MEEISSKQDVVSLDLDTPIWGRFYMVAPLVVIGTKENKGYDLAPKHMAMPMGWNHYFGFVCTPRHATYHNAKHYGAFTVSFPLADQVVLTSLAASPRCDKPGSKPILQQLPTISAEVIDGVFLKDSYLFLECNLERVVDGFGVNSLIVGEIAAAHVSKNALRESESDDQQLIYRTPLLAFLPPDRFSTISESLAYPYPANFEK
jgi:flavin reductase (DIM6/NTAB) family NADH-FMN oxidoreductase RutF